MRKKDPQLSIVVPVYNESEGITKFHQSLSKILALHSLKAQIIYVDDGSVDDSPQLIKKIAKKDKSVKPLFLSKNFGKEAATSAGIHSSLGDATIIIDADGQHPVELIPNFVNAWKDGYNVVVGVRKTNQKEGIIKKIGSQLFYTALKLLGVPNTIPGTTDYSLIDREVANAFNNLTEHNRITRSLIDWLGYRRKYIYYNAKPREYGNASYSTKKLISLAMNGFISLSFKPLYFSGYLGVLIVFLSFIASCLTLINKYVINDPLNLNVTGTALLAMLIISLVGFLMIGQGLLALYIARIYSETQDRPLYIVKNHEKH
jgi:glycosyltransferase involved in cell wall biosynthesis